VGATDLNSPEWVDASRAALAQGALRIEVMGVTVAPVALRNSSGKPTYTPEKYLNVRLRIYRTKSGGIRTEGARPVLTDPTGRVYSRPALDLPANAIAAGESLPPMLDEVFVFEAPSADSPFLHLEIPSEPWGGLGTFRFALPKEMMWIDNSRGPRDRNLKGG
jgi:hypothetical protein